MTKINQGAQVKVHFRGVLENGVEFDSTFGKNPLSFTFGQEMVISGVEQALLQMELGEKRTLTLSAEQAFGEHRKKLIAEINCSQLPDYVQAEPGMMLEVRSEQGKVLPAIVRQINQDKIVVDGNHPLAGQKITLEIELLSVSD